MHAMQVVLEEWQSGWTRRSWKPFYWKVTGVRIPPPLQITSYDEGTRLRTGSKGTIHIGCYYFGLLVKLVIMLPCHGRVHGFESRTVRIKMEVCRSGWTERSWKPSYSKGYLGFESLNFRICSVRLVVRSRPFHGRSTGSNPVPSTKYFLTIYTFL